MEKEQFDVIMQNEEVKKAVKQAGEDALKNPEVQAQMLKVAQDKFPDMAHSAASKIEDWANDPELNENAKAAAIWAFEVGKDLAEDAAEKVMDLVQQGPAGIRVLAFAGSCVAFAVALRDVLKFWDLLLHASDYVTDVWQVLFAFTSMLFEAHPETIEKYQILDRYHDHICMYGKGLCFPLGRSWFYFFQSSLWISEVFNDVGVKQLFKSPLDLVKFGIGIYMCILGVFNLWMHYGIMPIQGLNKTAGMAAPVLQVAARAARQTVAIARDKFEDMAEGRRSSRGSLRASLTRDAEAGGSEIELGPPTFKNNE